MNASRLTLTAGLGLATLALAACGSDAPRAEPTTPTSPSNSPSTVPSATPTPTEAPSEQPTPPPTPAVLDVRGLETGADPGLAFATLSFQGTMQRGGVLHAVDGTTTPLPAYSLNEFAPLGDGWVVDMVDPDNGDEFVYLLSARGDYAEPWSASGGIAVSGGGNVVAWTGLDGTVHAAHAKTGDVLTLPKVPAGRGSYRTVGVTSEDCKEGRSNDAGCGVVVNSGQKAYVATSHGIVDTVPGMIAATAADGRRVGGMYSVDENKPGSCSRMRVTFGRALWKTCDNTLDAIAPDGKHLLGLPGYLDGFGPTTLDILSMADGKAIRSWTGTRNSATYFDQVWEDSSHVLVRTFQQGRWAIVRVGVDGSLEYAAEPVRADALTSPFMLQTR